MNKNKEKSIMKIALGMYKKRFQTLMLPTSIFAIFCFISLALGIMAPLSLFISIPFLVIPSLFAFSAVSTIASEKDNHEGRGFFVMFRSYFSGFFRGCYRVIIGFFKGLLASFAASLVLTPIFSLTILNNDPSYLVIEESLKNAVNIDVVLEEYITFVETSTTFKNVMFVINMVSFLAGLIVFLHHFSKNSVKVYHNFLSTAPIPMSDLNLIHKVTLKKIKKSFNKDYYSSLWFLLLLVIISFVGFACIANFLLQDLIIDQIIVIGLFGVFVSTIFFIPYYFNVLQLLYQKYAHDYIDTFVDLSLKSIEEIKKTTQIDPEKEKQIRDFLDAQKKENEKSNRDNK